MYNHTTAGSTVASPSCLTFSKIRRPYISVTVFPIVTFLVLEVYAEAFFVFLLLLLEFAFFEEFEKPQLLQWPDCLADDLKIRK